MTFLFLFEEKNTQESGHLALSSNVLWKVGCPLIDSSVLNIIYKSV